MFRIFYHPHHRHHGRMGLGRALLMGLLFGPWLFRRMMRWGRAGGYGWYGGPRGGWGGGWGNDWRGGPRGPRSPRGSLRGEYDRGPRGGGGPRGPRGADFV